ncbi:MAG: EipB family protein [Alphaproteobacteria bacterium]
MTARYKTHLIKRLMWGGVFVWCFSISSLPAHAVLDPAREAGFVPHKALYDIYLSSKKSSAKVANIHGKMVYEWQPSCDAWVSSHHFDVTYEYVETPAMRITSDFSTYESFDGKDFNFTSQRKREGLVFEELRGNVRVQEEMSYPNEAVYSIPEDLVFDLPEGTLFPMAHTLDVMDKINAGQKFYNATMFDGSDEDGPVNINSFVGKPTTFTPDEEHQKHIDAALIKNKAWKLRLAFFPLNRFEETSDYEMSVVFHENGVISDMEIEYDSFSVVQKLVAIEKLDSNCEVSDEQLGEQ